MLNKILKNAEKLREMHARIDEAFHREPHGPEHQAATKAFHESYDALAFPEGLNQAMERLKNHDTSIVDEVVTFLKEDPAYFRSGYHKEKMLRRLKSFPLTEAQQSSLASLVIRSVDGGPHRIFSAYARLAPKINSTLLQSEILARLHSDDPEIKRRASHVYDLISAK